MASRYKISTRQIIFGFALVLCAGVIWLPPIIGLIFISLLLVAIGVGQIWGGIKLRRQEKKIVPDMSSSETFASRSNGFKDKR